MAGTTWNFHTKVVTQTIPTAPVIPTTNRAGPIIDLHMIYPPPLIHKNYTTSLLGAEAFLPQQLQFARGAAAVVVPYAAVAAHHAVTGNFRVVVFHHQISYRACRMRTPRFGGYLLVRQNFPLRDLGDY